MNKDYHDDQDLVNFLKNNQPTFSPSDTSCENQLMSIIACDNNQVSKRKKEYFWAIPTAIAFGFLFMFGNSIKSNFSTQIVQEKENLEAFMINAWRESMAEKVDNNQINMLEEEWLLLTEKELVSSSP